jgi:tripartite-type tricarboxylate transporter receptor subunit TctC
MGPVEGHLKSGKLKAIAVPVHRLAALPDVQTVARTRCRVTIHDVVRSRGCRPEHRARYRQLNADLRKTMASAEVKEKLASIGGDLTVNSPDDSPQC